MQWGQMVMKIPPYLSMTIPGAAGAIISNVDDLLTWNTALFAGEVVSHGVLRRDDLTICFEQWGVIKLWFWPGGSKFKRSANDFAHGWY